MQELLRHSTIRVTLDTYTQAVTTEKRNAQEAVVALLFPEKRRKRKLCLDGLYFLYLFCAFLCPREIGVLSVSALERMAGTTRLELATSAVTGRYPGGGLSGFSGLRVFLVAYGGLGGHRWEGVVQRFVQRWAESERSNPA